MCMCVVFLCMCLCVCFCSSLFFFSLLLRKGIFFLFSFFHLNDLLRYEKNEEVFFPYL